MEFLKITVECIFRHGLWSIGAPKFLTVSLTKCKVIIKDLPLADQFIINAGSLHFNKKSNLLYADNNTESTYLLE